MRKPNLGILFKPAGHDCNMACDYCYYRSAGRLYPGVDRPRMTPDVFEAACEQYLALGPNEIKFGWQGGEPTLLGLDFFRQVVGIERSHARSGDCFGNGLQTNGVVLDDEWCGFLAANRFLVGLSVDGPEDLNVVRRFPNGRPAFDVTMRALELLKKHNVEFNILVVISMANVDHARRIFRFLVDGDLHYSQFIPCTEPTGEPGVLSEHSITAAQYADFMIELFDAWVENDDPTYYVRGIDNWLHLFFGLPPECCEFRGDCSNLVTVEWNGDVYPCDFYVQEHYLLGNVRRRTLEQMLSGPVFREFVRRAHTLPRVCEGCEWLAYCHGGCYRHREKLGIGGDGVPYLCEANKRIFSHVFGTLEEIKERAVRPQLHAFLNRIGRDVEVGSMGAQAAPPAPRAGRPAARRAPGRNDPCPCGSGRKLKHCCGRRVRSAS